MGLWNWGKGKKQPQISTIVEVDSDKVSCTGATNAHPKVWYTVPEDGYIQCGYCDIMFMRKKLTETEKMDKHFNGTTYTKDGIDNDFCNIFNHMFNRNSSNRSYLYVVTL